MDIEKIEVIGKRPLNQLFKIRNEKKTSIHERI